MVGIDQGKVECIHVLTSKVWWWQIYTNDPGHLYNMVSDTSIHVINCCKFKLANQLFLPSLYLKRIETLIVSDSIFVVSVVTHNKLNLYARERVKEYMTCWNQFDFVLQWKEDTSFFGSIFLHQFDKKFCLTNSVITWWLALEFEINSAFMSPYCKEDDPPSSTFSLRILGDMRFLVLHHYVVSMFYTIQLWASIRLNTPSFFIFFMVAIIAET